MNSDYLLGIDIGGTKCAVILGLPSGGQLRVVDKEKFMTAGAGGPQECIEEFVTLTQRLLERQHLELSQIAGIGISCGGPLDSRTGVIMSPPNLPGWDDVRIVEQLRRKLPVERIVLQNDANACAVAEWKYGAGRGCRNMVFLTCGTGMGGGLILDGHLYSGTNDMAGECGHMRLAPFGPVGYQKAGSFEGFCSGGGIAQLGRMKAMEALQQGQAPSWCRTADALDRITTKDLAEAAAAGELLAQEVFRIAGDQLGRALAVLVDILNPEKIVIGSVFARSEKLLRPAMDASLKAEALGYAQRVCQVVPAGLGEAIGDIASLSLAAGGY